MGSLLYSIFILFTYCSTRIYSKVCYPARDIVFIVNVDSDVTAADFLLVKDFLYDFIALSKTNIDAGYIQIGLVAYSTTATFVFNLQHHSTAVSMQNDVTSLTAGTTTSNTNVGLQELIANANWRSSATYTRIGILLSTQPSDDGTLAAQTANGIQLAAIGVQSPGLTELRSVATNNQHFALLLPSFASLSSLAPQLYSSLAGYTHYSHSVCVTVSCATPVASASSQLCSCTAGPFSEGDAAVFECASGYGVQGSPLWTCLSTGNWSGDPVGCLPLPTTGPSDSRPTWLTPLLSALAGLLWLLALLLGTVLCCCPRAYKRCRVQCSCDKQPDVLHHRPVVAVLEQAY